MFLLSGLLFSEATHCNAWGLSLTSAGVLFPDSITLFRAPLTSTRLLTLATLNCRHHRAVVFFVKWLRRLLHPHEVVHAFIFYLLAQLLNLPLPHLHNVLVRGYFLHCQPDVENNEVNISNHNHRSHNKNNPVESISRLTCYLSARSVEFLHTLKAVIKVAVKVCDSDGRGNNLPRALQKNSAN